MILKLGMKPLGMELYKVYINHYPVMTLRQGQHTSPGHAAEWGKIVKMSFEGKTLKEMGKWAEQKIYDSEKNLDPRGWSAPIVGQYTCIFRIFRIL